MSQGSGYEPGWEFMWNSSPKGPEDEDDLELLLRLECSGERSSSSGTVARRSGVSGDEHLEEQVPSPHGDHSITGDGVPLLCTSLSGSLPSSASDPLRLALDRLSRESRSPRTTRGLLRQEDLALEVVGGVPKVQRS